MTHYAYARWYLQPQLPILSLSISVSRHWLPLHDCVNSMLQYILERTTVLNAFGVSILCLDAVLLIVRIERRVTNVVCVSCTQLCLTYFVWSGHDRILAYRCFIQLCH